MFLYYLYSKYFISDIKLFNIPESHYNVDKPDVIIHQGKIHLNNSQFDKNSLNINNDKFIMKFLYGTLQICSGNEILYELNPDYDVESLTPFIVGWGIAVVLTQMNYSTFHCSALVHNDIGFFVSGISGAGKSTTAISLIQRGCKYLTDDIAIIDSYENMMIPPAYPVQKVCHDVSLSLNKDLLYSINNDRGKYAYLNISDYCDTPKKLTYFFQLSLSDKDHVEVTEITGVNRFYKIVENLYLSLQYAQTDLSDKEMFRCLKIAGNIRFFLIKRPKGKDTLNEITNSILKILDE